MVCGILQQIASLTQIILQTSFGEKMARFHHAVGAYAAALYCCSKVFDGELVVFLFVPGAVDAVSLQVALAQIAEPICISLLCRAFEPVNGLCLVHFDTIAVVVVLAETVLRLGVAALGFLL